MLSKEANVGTRPEGNGNCREVLKIVKLPKMID
jgi:hypothetical protein